MARTSLVNTIKNLPDGGISAKVRRKVWFWVMITAFGPGAAATYLFRNHVWWVNLLSWLALWIAAGGAWAAETPVEEES